MSMITDAISFRPLREDDLPLLLEWLGRDHIKRWWDDGNDTLEKVRAHYTRDPDTTKRFILLLAESEIPAGYFQYYLKADGVIGIDQFLADNEKLGKGLGRACISEFVRLIRERHSPTRIITDPHPDNARAIRCYEKVGFKHCETLSEGATATYYLMKLELGI